MHFLCPRSSLQATSASGGCTTIGMTTTSSLMTEEPRLNPKFDDVLLGTACCGVNLFALQIVGPYFAA